MRDAQIYTFVDPLCPDEGIGKNNPTDRSKTICAGSGEENRLRRGAAFIPVNPARGGRGWSQSWRPAAEALFDVCQEVQVLGGPGLHRAERLTLGPADSPGFSASYRQWILIYD